MKRQKKAKCRKEKKSKKSHGIKIRSSWNTVLNAPHQLPKRNPNTHTHPIHQVPDSVHISRSVHNGRACAEEVQVTKGVVDTSDRRPKLLLPQPGERVGGLLARVGPVPAGATVAVAADDVVQRVRAVLEDVARLGLPALLDVPDLGADADERVGEPVQLGLGLALGRLDHERVGHGPAHGRGVEAVVLQTLGDVDGLDARSLGERPRVQDELVSAATLVVGVENRVVRLEARQEVVCVEDRNLGCLFESVGTYWCGGCGMLVL